MIEKRIEVLSLDVFDTIVWRSVAEPADAFLLLGERLRPRGLLAPGLGAAQFRRLRVEAEHRARAGCRAAGRVPEVSLLDIWREIPASAVQGSRADLAARELALERALLRADLDIVEVIDIARQLGKSVVAVSDTYLSPDEVRAVALSRKPLSPNLFTEVFTSSACGQSKENGLFDLILARLGVGPEAVLHVGDNHTADVRRARSAGLAAVGFPRRIPGFEHALRHERAHGASVDPFDGDYGLTALRVKATACEPEDLAEADRPYFRWGAAHIGPVMTGFAEWVCERTRALGSGSAFCLMRDGALLAPLVEAAARKGPALSIHKLWLSREVLARASIRHGDQYELANLVDRRRAPTVRELCATLAIELASTPELAKYADARLNDPHIRDWVLRAISSESALRSAVVDHSARLRERIARLVTGQAGFGERLVLVDIGWAATIQRALQGLLAEQEVPIQIYGLYLVTRWHCVAGILDGTHIEGYLVQLNEPEAAADTIARSPELLEQLCMPDHGTQVSLAPDGSPVVSADRSDEAQRSQRKAAAAGVRTFQELWLRYAGAVEGGLASLNAGARHHLLAITIRALASPTLEEAAALSAWVHEDNHGSNYVGAIATPVEARALRYMDPQALVDLSASDVYWPFGLAAIHDPDLARALELFNIGLIGWEAFASVADTGGFEIFPDLGQGFAAELGTRVNPHRNRYGLSYIRAHVVGDGIKRLRIDPTEAPAMVRIDWIGVRCWIRGFPEPAFVQFRTDADFAPLETHGLDRLTPRAFLATSSDPQIIVDLDFGEDDRVYFADVDCAFATMAVPKPLEMVLTRGNAVDPAGHSASDGKRRARGSVRGVMSAGAVGIRAGLAAWQAGRTGSEG